MIQNQPPPTGITQLVTRLQDQDELRTITDLDPAFEIAAITRRICAIPGGGPAVLFRLPNNPDASVITNLFGSTYRQELALGVPKGIRALHDRIAPCLEESSNQWMLPTGLVPTRTQRPDQLKRTESFSLRDLPTIRNWPLDGTAAGEPSYLTLAQVHTISPESGEVNCGIYRCQIHSDTALAIRWRESSGAAKHHREYRRIGKPMPVTITMGGPAALTLAAAWPLPPAVDEVHFAGWLQNHPIQVFETSHAPLLVPSGAELVLEGFADTEETLLEGPFGNYTGQYDPPSHAPRITITGYYQRAPLYLPATVVGPPPQEDCIMMHGWERILAAMLSRCLDCFYDISLPASMVFNGGAIISLTHVGDRTVQDVVRTLWELPWFRSARLLLIVDQDIDVHDPTLPWWGMVQGTESWHRRIITDETGTRIAINATGQTKAALVEPQHISTRMEHWQKEFGFYDWSV